MISIIDENFNILDNPYGEIKFHRYTTLADAWLKEGDSDEEDEDT